MHIILFIKSFVSYLLYFLKFLISRSLRFISALLTAYPSVNGLVLGVLFSLYLSKILYFTQLTTPQFIFQVLSQLISHMDAATGYQADPMPVIPPNIQTFLSIFGKLALYAGLLSSITLVFTYTLGFSIALSKIGVVLFAPPVDLLDGFNPVLAKLQEEVLTGRYI